MLKETIKSRRLLALWLCTLMLLLNVNYADAQNFEQTGAGTYSVGKIGATKGKTTTAKRGIIRMKGTSEANGAINGIGTGDASRIEGTVIWARDGKDQNVQDLYYTNLGVQNTGKKIFGTDGYVGDITQDVKAYHVSNKFMRYQASTPSVVAEPYTRFAITDYASSATTLPNIVHYCNSDFFYDGAWNQEILGSFKTGGANALSDNVYVSLQKTTAGSPFFYTPTITGVWTNSLNTPTHVVINTGKLELADVLVCTNIPPSVDDSIKVEPPPPDPPVDPEDPTPTDPPVDPNNDPCAITLGPGKVMEVDKALYFVDATGKVITSAAESPFCVTAGEIGNGSCDAPEVSPAHVIYAEGSQTIAPARVSNDGTNGNWKGYGVVRVEGQVGVGGEVIIAGPMNYALTVVDNGGVNTANTLYGGDATTKQTIDEYQRITFAEACANAVYTTEVDGSGKPVDEAGCGEVLGWLYRTKSNTTTQYTYHNTATRMQFATLPASPTESFGMLMLPKGVGNTTFTAWDGVGTTTGTTEGASKAEATKQGSGYIQRLWEVDYNGADGELTNISLGFVASEIDQALTDLNTPENQNAWQEALRGYEAYLSGNTPPHSLTTLASDVNGVPTDWTFGSDARCGTFYTALQPNGLIYLNGATAPGDDGSNVAVSDIGKSSQFVFGNQPLFFTSKRNGRWSDPGTWDKGSTPTARDNVEIIHTIYTGYFDQNADNQFIGGRQWSVNEHDLKGVTAVDGSIVLADSVTIKNVGINNQYAALVIGSYETAGRATEATAVQDPNASAMDFTKPLLFKAINNTAVTTGDPSTVYDLTRATLGSNYTSGVIQGLWITSSAQDGTSASNSTGALTIGIINPRNSYNSGTLVNEGLLDLGHDQK